MNLQASFKASLTAEGNGTQVYILIYLIATGQPAGELLHPSRLTSVDKTCVAPSHCHSALELLGCRLELLLLSLDTLS